MCCHVYGTATQQAGISHVLHILGAHLGVTASFAYLTTHAALDPASSIIMEAAAIMRPYTSSQMALRHAPAPFKAIGRLFVAFSSYKSTQASGHTPAVHCRRSIHAHSLGWQHRSCRRGSARAADTCTAAGAGCPGPHHPRGPHEQAESGAQSGPAHAGQWQLRHSCSRSRQAAPPICRRCAAALQCQLMRQWRAQ